MAKHKLQNGMKYLPALKEYLRGLLNQKLLDSEKPLSDKEYEYNEYMHTKLLELIEERPHLKLVFDAPKSNKTVKALCLERGISYKSTSRNAEREAAECFDILKVYENFVLKLIGWEDETEVVKNGSYNTSELSLSTAEI